MKSEIVVPGNGNSELTYPRLMLSKKTGAVVFFIEPSSGICVLPSGDDEEYEYSVDWDDESFEDFDGVIQLSND